MQGTMRIEGSGGPLLEDTTQHDSSELGVGVGC